MACALPFGCVMGHPNPLTDAVVTRIVSLHNYRVETDRKTKF
jgi:hypothetical protein